MTEQEIREASILVVAGLIADLRSCADADAPERLEVMQRLLTQLERGAEDLMR
jgi:hypothetical protein